MRIIEAVARRMGINKDQVMINIEKYGNTTNATIIEFEFTSIEGYEYSIRTWMTWDEALKMGNVNLPQQ